jgi:hypothetical protein
MIHGVMDAQQQQTQPSASNVNPNETPIQLLADRVVRSIRDRLVLAGLDHTSLEAQREPITEVVVNGLREIEYGMRHAASGILATIAAQLAEEATQATHGRTVFRIVTIDPLAQAANHAARRAQRASSDGQRGPLVAPSTK